jgi:uncharacterized membrane protein YkoI
MRTISLLIHITLVCALAVHGPASGQRRDHDKARDAVASGERLSLSTILARIETSHGGRILEIERDTLAGREVYEIELLGDDGRVVELAVDAANGEIIGSEYDD